MKKPPAKRIVLTGGGTGGHVTPHRALLPRLLESGYEVHYIGTARGMERGMMSRPGIIYHAVPAGKLRRYFDWKNISDPFLVLAGFLVSAALMLKLRPRVCFAKGGFVSVPVVLAAWAVRVPVLLHESDATPGLANRICARFAKKVATTFPDCALAMGDKGVHTGTPLRPELFLGSRERGLALAGFEGRKPVLLVMGGSQGADFLNRTLRGALHSLLPDMDILHQCGKGHLDPALKGRKGYFQAEFLDEAALPDAMACAEAVLSRAGATALSEFAALRLPMLLVPYPQTASRGDQIENAADFSARGLALALRQEDLDPAALAEAVRDLLARAEELRENLKKTPAADGTAAVFRLIEEIRKPG